MAMITRLTWDGEEITAPLGTNKCALFVGRPHPSDWTHWLFAPDNTGPMVQLLTRCGRRAQRFVLESEGKEVDCPECLGRAPGTGCAWECSEEEHDYKPDERGVEVCGHCGNETPSLPDVAFPP